MRADDKTPPPQSHHTSHLQSPHLPPPPLPPSSLAVASGCKKYSGLNSKAWMQREECNKQRCAVCLRGLQNAPEVSGWNSRCDSCPQFEGDVRTLEVSGWRCDFGFEAEMLMEFFFLPDAAAECLSSRGGHHCCSTSELKQQLVCSVDSFCPR